MQFVDNVYMQLALLRSWDDCKMALIFPHLLYSIFTLTKWILKVPKFYHPNAIEHPNFFSKSQDLFLNQVVSTPNSQVSVKENALSPLLYTVVFNYFLTKTWETVENTRKAFMWTAQKFSQLISTYNAMYITLHVASTLSSIVVKAIHFQAVIDR